MRDRPHTTLILAISADGKISNSQRSGDLFGSDADYAHLQRQMSLCDGAISGGATQRAHGSAVLISLDNLRREREARGQPAQPIQMVCSRSGQFDPDTHFFRQPVERWLVTTPEGAALWRDRPHFQRLLAPPSCDGNVDLEAALGEMWDCGIRRLAVLGGGSFVASMFRADLIDEWWLTVCPLAIGGADAPTPVDGVSFAIEARPRLQLLEVERVEDELFLHYRVRRSPS